MAGETGKAESELLDAGGDRLEQVLVAQHGKFLGFLERRLGSRADAEEVLQAAYVRALEKGVPDDDGVVAWFYRVLRNALVDRARRRDAERRSTERLARELEEGDEPELREVVCACMHDLLPEMKPEYADMVRAVDLEQRALADAAAAVAITVNNATVRLHRARQALKKQLLRSCGACAAHGCLDCHCRTVRSRGGQPPPDPQKA
jgi:RNA polymerase sigma-70 factor (ECF subfamily)